MPFAGYKDFSDCVAKNRDKRDPQAYCATIMRGYKEGKKQQLFSRRALEKAQKR